MDAPTLEALTTVAGATVVVLLVTQIVAMAWKPTPEMKDRFMPLIAVAIGVVVVLLADFALNLLNRTTFVEALITGLFAGWAASGAYDTLRGITR